ncbi:MAG: Gldg family protein [Bacillota bacterium]|jgi:ABC-2 type transport system permease protein
MKILKKTSLKDQFSGTTSKHGSLAAGLIALAVIIAIVFNLLVSQLPESWSALDISGRDLYNVSETSVEFLQSLNEDIQLIVLAEDGTIDSRIEKFINKYASLSEHIYVKYIDPIQYPSALTDYNAQQDSIAVICKSTNKQQNIAFSDIIQYDTASYYTTGQYTETAFDAEGQLTSAIDYVTNDASKTAYTLAGHNESELASAVTSQMEKSRFTVNSLNLLTDGGIPDNCDLIICNAPTADLADDELAMLKEYLKSGGHLTLLLSDKDADTPNLNALMQEYGIAAESGYLADYSRYYQDNPYIFFPISAADSKITESLSDDDLILVYNSGGLQTTAPARDTITTESFLTSSDQSAMVTGSTEKAGQYAVAVAASEEISDSITANLTVYAAQSIIAEDIISAFSNVSNLDVFMNSLTNGFADISNISVEPKSLDMTYNTISAAGLWSVLTVIVIPLSFLCFGLIRWLKRKKL